jgi:hypothetical protein
MRFSPTKIESFIRCPRCAILEMKRRVPKLPSFPFTVNNAVDRPLRRKFDTCRERVVPHPLMVEAGIEAVPFRQAESEQWSDAWRDRIEREVPELGGNAARAASMMSGGHQSVTACRRV